MPFATVDDQSRRGAGWSDDRSPMSDGRSIVVGVVALYLTLVAGMRALRDLDIWPWLGVPSDPASSSMRGTWLRRSSAAGWATIRWSTIPVTRGAGSCSTHGYGWCFAGLASSSVTLCLFGVVVITVFLVLLLLLFGRLSVVEGLVVAVAVCSPAVMFAVERANMDLVVSPDSLCPP